MRNVRKLRYGERGFALCVQALCGMKYSPEEAKKMMVEIEGAVKIDDSEELANLHVLARRALDANSIDNALKYYDMILIKEPTNWEAAFYSLVFNATNCKVGELSCAFKQIENGIPQIVDLVKNNLTEEEKRCAYEEIANHLVWESSVANSSASKCSIELFVSIRKDVCLALYQFVGALRIAFPNKEFINAEMICLKEAIRMNSFYRNDESMKQLYDYYIEYIKQNSTETFQQVTTEIQERSNG